MLSIRPIGSSAEETNYYANLGEKENHDYYSEDGVRPGAWWGSGAERLGLKSGDDVKPEDFKNVLEGVGLDGETKLVQNARDKSRRAAFDLTWSCPKSWSVAWSQADSETRREFDERAGRALARALGAFQELCGKTRRGHNGTREEDAGLVGAIFQHDTARGLPGEVPDANKHFHVVIANVVAREDGTTGTLDARPLFRRRMKMALGAMFRAELSKEMEEMGLRTHRPQRDGKTELASWFELADVPAELIQAMSKRRNEIEKWLRKHGLSGAKAAEKAALITREVKGIFTQADLNRAWSELGQEYGFTRLELDSLLKSAQPRAFEVEKEKTESVARALKNIMSSRARFTEVELLECVAVESQCRGLGIHDIRAAVSDTLEHSPEVVRLKNDGTERQFTTQEMLNIERKMLRDAEHLSQSSSHAVGFHEVHRVLKGHDTLRPEQREAIRYIASGADVSTVNGIAGSGKTFMLSVAREVLEGAGFEVLGTTLSAKASRGLEEGSGIKSVHIHRLLYEVEKGKLEINSGTVVVVDEAGMVGTREMSKLTQLVSDAGAKLVLVGDHKQLQAISAGSPFKAIGERFGSVELTQIIRQREEWARRLVHDLRDGQAESALEELDRRGRLFIGQERDDAIEQLVSDWKEAAVDKQELRGSIVFAGTNLEVRELNRRAQSMRLVAGELAEASIELEGLDIHVHDRVMITRNNALLNLKNGTLGVVARIDEKSVTVKLDDGFQVEIDTDDFKHLTLGYAMSVHRGQGVTCENAFILTGDGMTDRQMSYVEGSRARTSTRLYSDRLSAGEIPDLATIMNRSRQKDMAIDFLPEVA